jgi:hypothetical protein
MQKRNGAWRNQEKRGEDDGECGRGRRRRLGPEKMLIVSEAGALDFSGILGGLQVVGNRNHGQKDERKDGQS